MHTDLVIDTYLRSIWTRPDTEVIDTPTWFQVRTPSATLNNLNNVRRAILDDVDGTLDEVLADHQTRGSVLRWTVSPICRPLDLVARLLARGFVNEGEIIGMTKRTDPMPMPPGVDVVPVGLEDLDGYMEVMAAGWGLGAEGAAEMRNDIGAILADPHHPVRYFLGRCDGEAAGTGSVRSMPGRGYLIGGSVAPAFRGRGVYRALVSARMAWMAERGFDLAVIVAMASTSAPICLGLGFEEVCRFTHLRWDPS